MNMPQAYINKLKATAVLIGHERCAASQFCDQGTILVCAIHGHQPARSVLKASRIYMACRECIAENCVSTWARTEERPRGLYIDPSTNTSGL